MISNCFVSSKCSSVVANQPLLSCEVDLLPPDNICSEPVVTDEVETFDVSVPSAVAVTNKYLLEAEERATAEAEEPKKHS